MKEQPAVLPHDSASRSTGLASLPDTALGMALGLGDDDVDLMGKLFGELTASLGIDGGPVFERLARGQSIGQALAVPESVVERIYARAHRWFALGKTDRAAPLFRALCLLRDEDADFWVGHGVCLRVTGQFAKAQTAFEAASNLRPNWAVPCFHLLELALHRKQWPQARAALAAYDTRVRDARVLIAPDIASEVVRLRAVLEYGFPDARADTLGDPPSGTALTSHASRARHEP